MSTEDQNVEVNEEERAIARGDVLPEDKNRADEDLKEVLGEKEETSEDEDRPRDSVGKFTKKEKDDEPRIPKAEFDSRLNKERDAREAAERRAQELETRVKQEEKSADVQKMEDQIENLEAKYNDLLMDGEKEKASAVMKEIRHMERNIARMESDEKTNNATAQAVEHVRMEATIAKLEADYPEFNKESKDFDSDLVDLTLAEQRRLMQDERMSPSAALLRAGTKIMDKFGKRDSAPEEKGLGAARKLEDRKSSQVKKNIDTSSRQPASTKDTGLDSDKLGINGKVDIAKLTFEEYKALPESTRAKLRGDFAEV